MAKIIERYITKSPQAEEAAPKEGDEAPPPEDDEA